VRLVPGVRPSQGGSCSYILGCGTVATVSAVRTIARIPYCDIGTVWWLRSRAGPVCHVGYTRNYNQDDSYCSDYYPEFLAATGRGFCRVMNVGG